MDTANRFLVSVQGDDIIVMLPPVRMTRAEALTFAAWVVALADESDDDRDFKEVLSAVQAL